MVLGKTKSSTEPKGLGKGLPGIQKRAGLIGAAVTTVPVSKGTLFAVSYAFKN